MKPVNQQASGARGEEPVGVLLTPPAPMLRCGLALSDGVRIV